MAVNRAHWTQAEPPALFGAPVGAADVLRSWLAEMSRIERSAGPEIVGGTVEQPSHRPPNPSF
jgi:hypothetical protein